MALVKFSLVGFVIIAGFALALANMGNAAPAGMLPMADVDAAETMLYEASEEERAFGLALITAAPPVEVLGDHANKHAEVAIVRKTCREQGVYSVWRETDNKARFHLLCMTVDGKLVDWIVQVVGRRVVEVSAFMPKDGTPHSVVKYVLGRATRFTKELIGR